jgi:PhnB protein
MVMKQSVYLFFTTCCEPALAHYEMCGLGKATILLRYGDRGAAVRTSSMRGKVLHAVFEGPGVHFFASDNDDAEPMKGSAMQVQCDDLCSAAALFTALAADGKVTVPLQLKSWGGHFGMLIDRFGVQWMLNANSPGV